MIDPLDEKLYPYSAYYFDEIWKKAGEKPELGSPRQEKIFIDLNKFHVEHIPVSDTFSIKHIKNIKIVNEDPSVSENKIEFKGNYFIIWAGHRNIFHLLSDIFGQYLFIKESIPDLKAIPVAFKKDGLWDIVHTIPELMNISNIDQLLDITEYSQIYIENLYFITTAEDKVLINILGDESCQRLHYQSIDNLADKNSHYTVKTLNAIKKAVDNKYIPNSDPYPEKILLDIPEIKYTEQSFWEGSDSYKNTYLNEYEVLFARRHFSTQGFVIIKPWELSFEQQVQYIRNAKVVIAFSSSNLVHSIWSSHETRFLFLDPHCFHFLAFSQLIKNHILNGIVVSDSNEYRMTRFNNCIRHIDSILQQPSLFLESS